jgi:hypothetical protein
MFRNLVLASFAFTGLMLFSCLGSDPNSNGSPENTKALCTNGEDDDGDNNFDCYDPDCRAVDSLARILGDTICHYEDYRSPVAIPSSGIDGTSSIGASSSSATSSASVSGQFPVEIPQDNDSVQVLALFNASGSTEIIAAGRIGRQGLRLTMDSTGNILDQSSEQTPDDLLDSLLKGVLNSYGLPTGRVFLGVDTTLDGNVNFFGYSTYSSRTFATNFFLTYADDRTWGNNGIWPSGEYLFMGANSSTSLCYVINNYGASAQLDTGYIAIDANVTDGQVPTKVGKLLSGVMTGGEVVEGNKCAAVGTRSVLNPDSSQIWYYLVNKLNEREAMAQITTGNANERAYDLETVAGKTYIAATVGNVPRMLVVSATQTVEVDGSAQGLNVGTPKRIRAIQVGGVTRLLMVGEAGGKGMLWLMGTDGSKVNSAVIPDMNVLTDVVQLPGENLIVSGWKTTTGGGTTGIVLKMTTGFTVLN